MRTKLLVNWAFFGLVLIISLFLVGGSLISEPIGWKILAVGTDSMEPAIAAGSLAIIRNSSSYQLGDSVALRHELGGGDRSLLLQQISSTKQSRGELLYQVQSIAQPEFEPWFISGDRIVGRVVFSLPLLGGMLIWMRSSTGVWLTLFLPLALLAGFLGPKIASRLMNIDFKTLFMPLKLAKQLRLSLALQKDSSEK